MPERNRRVPGERAEGTRPDDETATFQEEARPAATVPSAAVPTPGEPPGSMVPEVHAAHADEEGGEVRRVRGVAHAPPGKPDGEVDTRP